MGGAILVYSLVLILFSFLLWSVFQMFLADRRCGRLDDGWEFYSGRMEARGVHLGQYDPGRDSAPCETRITFKTEDGKVDLDMGVNRGWRLIRKINSGKVTIRDLERMTPAKYSKLPKI